VNKGTIKGAPLAGRRVLLVEDQYLVAADLRRMVQGLGGVVVGPCPSVEEALQTLKREAIDLALLDINLGEETAYPIAEALRKQGSPFAFVTGYEPWNVDPRFADVPHLEKPVAPEGLLQLMNQFNEGARG